MSDNITYEVVTLENLDNEVTNPQLKEELINIFTADATIAEGEWRIAQALNNICVGEYFVKDWGDKKTLAGKLDMKPNHITRNVNAVQFMQSTLVNYGYSMLNMKYRKAYALSVVGSAQFDLFLDYCEENTGTRNMIELSVHTIEELVKNFKHRNDNVVEAEAEAQAEAEAEAQAEVEDNSFVGRYDDECVYFSVNDISYRIPFKSLKKYVES